MTLATRMGRGFGNDSLGVIARDFDGMLGQLMGVRPADGTRHSPYAVDVREDADAIFVDIDLPGFSKDEVHINLENAVLTISAERKSEESRGDESKTQWLLNERRYTRFERSFNLPTTVSEQDVNARLENGVLTVTLKKREESKPRKIEVQ